MKTFKTEEPLYLERSCYISEVSNTAANDQHLSCKGKNKVRKKSEINI